MKVQKEDQLLEVEEDSHLEMEDILQMMVAVVHLLEACSHSSGNPVAEEAHIPEKATDFHDINNIILT